MMTGGGFGFSEIEHTADWALEVWGPDLETLFAQAAAGMYWLMDVKLSAGPRVERKIELEGLDAEALLVLFLSELLFLGETEGLGFDAISLDIQGNRLSASAGGAPILDQKKEIKAVTYHNLAIQTTGTGCRVTIVFDV